jgi:hypothetical protein
MTRSVPRILVCHHLNGLESVLSATERTVITGFGQVGAEVLVYDPTGQFLVPVLVDRDLFVRDVANDLAQKLVGKDLDGSFHDRRGGQKKKNEKSFFRDNLLLNTRSVILIHVLPAVAIRCGSKGQAS